MKIGPLVSLKAAKQTAVFISSSNEADAPAPEKGASFKKGKGKSAKTLSPDATIPPNPNAKSKSTPPYKTRMQAEVALLEGARKRERWSYCPSRLKRSTVKFLLKCLRTCQNFLMPHLTNMTLFFCKPASSLFPRNSWWSLSFLLLSPRRK